MSTASSSRRSAKFRESSIGSVSSVEVYSVRSKREWGIRALFVRTFDDDDAVTVATADASGGAIDF